MHREAGVVIRRWRFAFVPGPLHKGNRLDWEIAKEQFFKMKGPPPCTTV
jgi:hypothetical protein